jgi:hypothetical protein
MLPEIHKKSKSTVVEDFRPFFETLLLGMISDPFS